MLYNVVLVSAVQQCESRSTKLSSLCCTAAFHYLPILHMIVYICQCYSQFVASSLPLPVPTSPFYTSVSLFLSCK